MNLNGKIIFLSFSVCFLLLLISGDKAAGEEKLNRVSVLLRDGSVIATEDLQYIPLVEIGTFSVLNQYMRLKSLSIGGVLFFHNQTKHILDWPEIFNSIRSIELLSPGLIPYKNGKMIISPKNGKKININNGTFLQYIGHDTATSYFIALEYDSYNNWWKETNIDIRNVKKIVFDSDEMVKAAIKGKIEKKLGFETTAEGMKKALTRTESGGNINLNIEFDFNSAKIRKDSYQLINELGKALLSLKAGSKKVSIKGHTDSDGKAAYNMKLSLRRARAVKFYLSKKFNLGSYKMQVKGYGETRPLVPNKNKRNKQMNRRVEIRLE